MGFNRFAVDKQGFLYFTSFSISTCSPPFGVAPSLMLRLLDAVWSKKAVGLAVSEFDPGRDVNDRSLTTLVWLLEYLLLKRHE